MSEISFLSRTKNNASGIHYEAHSKTNITCSIKKVLIFKKLNYISKWKNVKTHNCIHIKTHKCAYKMTYYSVFKLIKYDESLSLYVSKCLKNS